MCVGDIVVKNTRVLLGSTFESTQLAHVFNAILYATGASNSSYPSSPFGNEPQLCSIRQCLLDGSILNEEKNANTRSRYS